MCKCVRACAGVYLCACACVHVCICMCVCGSTPPCRSTGWVGPARRDEPQHPRARGEGLYVPPAPAWLGCSGPLRGGSRNSPGCADVRVLPGTQLSFQHRSSRQSPFRPPRALASPFHWLGRAVGGASPTRNSRQGARAGAFLINERTRRDWRR